MRRQRGATRAQDHMFITPPAELSVDAASFTRSYQVHRPKIGVEHLGSVLALLFYGGRRCSRGVFIFVKAQIFNVGGSRTTGSYWTPARRL